MRGRIWLRALAFAAVLVLPAAFAAPANAQDNWAAIAPNGENTAPVVRAPTRELARDRALAACRRVSRTCTDTPAITPNLNDVFSMVCCTSPRWACVAAPRSDRDAAVAEAQRVLDQHGFSQCKTQAFFSARTGERLALNEPRDTRNDRDDRNDRRDRDRDDRDPPANRDTRAPRAGEPLPAEAPPQRD